MTDDVARKVDNFFSQYPKRTYPKGQILVFADENPEHIFYITRGQVRKYDVSYRGEEVIITIFKSPSFFPMSWAINHTPNKYFYKTETPAVVHIAPADDALQFIRENPDVMLDLLSRLYLGLESVYGRIVHLMSGTARSRVAFELRNECRRFSEKQHDGSYVLSVTEVDLAARSGLSRETISREISKLKTQGLIALVNKNIVIRDVTKLEKSLNADL